VIYPLAKSHVSRPARDAGAAAEVTTSHKLEKYTDLDSRYLFELIAVESETLGVLNSSANSLLKEIGKKISFNTRSLGRPVSFANAFGVGAAC